MGTIAAGQVLKIEVHGLVSRCCGLVFSFIFPKNFPRKKRKEKKTKERVSDLRHFTWDDSRSVGHGRSGCSVSELARLDARNGNDSNLFEFIILLSVVMMKEGGVGLRLSTRRVLDGPSATAARTAVDEMLLLLLLLLLRRGRLDELR